MRNLRYIPESHQLTEITCRLNQGQFLFKPTREFNNLFLGVLGRAQQAYNIKIFGYAVLSNHFHLLIQPREAWRQAMFMKYLNTNVSKELSHLYKFYGPKFQRRYTSILISDEPVVQISRLRYVLSQGAKDGLVDSPLDWPGVHCAKALLQGKNDVGTWFDRTKQRIAKNQKRKPKRREIATDYEVKLSPLPCWKDCSEKEYQRRIAEMVQNIEAETKAMHRENRTRSLGVRRILRTNPLHTPRENELVHRSTHPRLESRDAKALLRGLPDLPDRLPESR